MLWFSQIVKTIKISRWSYCFFFLFSSLLYHVCVCLVCRWQRTAPVRARRKTHKHPAGLLVTRERERERAYYLVCCIVGPIAPSGCWLPHNILAWDTNKNKWSTHTNFIDFISFISQYISTISDCSEKNNTQFSSIYEYTSPRYTHHSHSVYLRMPINFRILTEKKPYIYERLQATIVLVFR